MNIAPNLKLPARETAAGAALLAIFCGMALAGGVSLLYGFWLFWHPGAFIAGGAVLLAIGALGALGRSAKQEEPW